MSIEQCPTCGSLTLGYSDTGLFCLCGWHEHSQKEQRVDVTVTFNADGTLRVEHTAPEGQEVIVRLVGLPYA